MVAVVVAGVVAVAVVVAVGGVVAVAVVFAVVVAVAVGGVVVVAVVGGVGGVVVVAVVFAVVVGGVFAVEIKMTIYILFDNCPPDFGNRFPHSVGYFTKSAANRVLKLLKEKDEYSHQYVVVTPVKIKER